MIVSLPLLTKTTEMIEGGGQRPKSLKRPHSRLEHASRTGASGAIQVGLSGNLGDTTLPPSKSFHTGKLWSYNTHYTKKHVADYNVGYTVGAVR